MPLLKDLTFDLDDVQGGGTIPYCPYHLVEDGYAGPTGNLGLESGSSFLMTYICPWKNHPRFCKILLGLNYLGDEVTVQDEEGSGSSQINRLSRTPPHKLPIDGQDQAFGYGNFYATEIVSITGIAGPDPYEYVTGSSGPKISRPTFGTVDNDNSYGNGLKYAYAKVTVRYQPLPYPALEDEHTPWDEEWIRFTTVQRTPRVELIQVQAGTLKWIDSPVKAQPEIVPHAMPIRDQSVDYVVTWHRVPFVIKDFESFIGYANSNTDFLIGHPQVPATGFAIDRMLLVGVQEILIPQPWSSDELLQLYTYSFFFQDRFNGHNWALRRQGAGDATTFDYYGFSFTGAEPTAGLAGNSQRAIKHRDMSRLFYPRS